MKFIIGKKLDMTQVWQGDKAVAVTRVQAGPCTIAQVKTDDKDGYSAVQVGYGERKEKNIAKPQLGHLAKLKTQNSKLKTNLRYLREFRCGDASKLKIGDVIDVNTFEVGDEIQVTGISKGKGFQGVVKRHGFHGQDKTHGTKDQLRMPGSIGATGPAHVFKGQKMPGRMGGDRVTVKGLEIVEVDQENDVLLVKGAVPGARNGLVLISGEGEIKVRSEKEPSVAKAVEGKEVRSDDEESGIINKESGGEVENKIKEDNKKDESTIVETQDVAVEEKGKEEIVETQKHESTKTIEHANKEVKKDEDIEKVVVEAKEKVEGKKKSENKK